MNQNRFDACPALAVLPSQHRYEDSGEGGNRKLAVEQAEEDQSDNPLRKIFFFTSLTFYQPEIPDTHYILFIINLAYFGAVILGYTLAEPPKDTL